MDRKGKEREIELLTERVSKSKALVFADFRKLKVSDMTVLRSKLRKSNSFLKVVKNRLARRVFAKAGLNQLEKYFDGPTAIASSAVDPVVVAKILVEFAKDNEFLKVKGGYLEGKVLEPKEINALAKLPSREILLSKAMASMLAPATNLACVLSAIPQKLVRAINAIKETKS